MGLPLWRDPDEEKNVKNALKQDATAAARSTIRRRPSIHGSSRRNGRVHVSYRPPHFAEENESSSSRRTQRRGVPPVSSLLESANRRVPFPLPPPSGALIQAALASQQAQPRGHDHRDLGHNIRRLRDTAVELEARLAGTHAGRRQPRAIGGVQEDFSSEELALVRRQAVAIAARTLDADRETATQRFRRTRTARAAETRRAAIEAQTVPEDGPLTQPPIDLSNVVERSTLRPETFAQISQRRLRRASPLNGLGDRNRSPTPTDPWDTIRTTITPDATLPSAESSFASAAASQSFSAHTRSSSSDRDANSTSTGGRDDDVQNDSMSSVDADELVCDEPNDLEMHATATFADDMYFEEMRTLEGRERISTHRTNAQNEGRRYALSNESDRVEIGFRMINSALDTEEGRERVYRLSRTRAPDRDFEDWLFRSRRPHRRARRARITDERPPSPHPERFTEATRTAARSASDHVHAYHRRVEADTLVAGHTSPPPRYEPPTSRTDVEVPAATTREPSDVLPPTPPSAQSDQDVTDLLLNIEDLGAMRRIVERLAARADVPDEWWMSLGLNLYNAQRRTNGQQD